MIDMSSLNIPNNFAKMQAKDSLKKSPLGASPTETIKSDGKNESSKNDFDKTLNDVSSSSSPREANAPGRSVDRVVSDSPRASIRKSPALETQETDVPSQDVAQPVETVRKVTRETAMEVFLDLMQNELGVKPENLVEAFSQLTDEQLSGSPEDSAQAVISQLGLDKKKSGQALELYNQMLAMTAAAGMSQYLQNNGQQAQIQVVDKKESQLQQLRHSIDDLNDKFFLNGAQPPMKTGYDQQAKMAEAYKSQLAMQNADISQMSESQGKESRKSEGSTADLAKAFAATSAAGMSTAGMTNVPPTPMAMPTQFNVAQADAMTESELEGLATPVEPDAKMNSIDDILRKLNSNQVPVEAQSANATPAASELKAHSFGAQVQGANAGSINPTHLAGAHISGEGQKQSGKNDSDESLSDSSLSGQAGGPQAAQEKSQAPFMVGAPKANEVHIQGNVKEVISHAQMLAQKGGGEMKITLTPEGMGEVNLKVKMSNGNVNVEMVTSNSETKKILEKGLGDLKDSLATHKLHLDSIKIENTKEASNQFDQRQQDQERGSQQRFLGDFQQRNNNFRREMFEFGAPSVPTSQIKDNAANTKYDPNQKRKTESSRRLDLVA